MAVKAKAIVECLDSKACHAVSRLELPVFDGRLAWETRRIERDFRLSAANVVFVVGTNRMTRTVGERVDRYRKAQRFAIGACSGGRASSPVSGVARIGQNRCRNGLRMFLTSIAAMLGEGIPEVFVCIDWPDVIEALNRPGELLFEWSSRQNGGAFDTSIEHIRRRLAGRACESVLCLLGGGQNPWFKELRGAAKDCREVLTENGTLLTGDRIAPFGGGPGCCLLAVASGRRHAVHQRAATKRLS